MGSVVDLRQGLSTLMFHCNCTQAYVQFLYQVSIRDLVQKSIERDLPDPAAFAETVIEDAVSADQDRLILLVRFTLLPSPTAYYMVVTLQIGSEGVSILDKKQLSYQQQLPHGSQHLQALHNPRLGYVEQGAILFAFFQNAIVLTSSLPGIPHQEFSTCTC